MGKLNLKNVEEIAHGDRFFIRSILSVFVTESEAYWGEVVSSHKKDIEVFRKAVHKAKSAAANIAQGDLITELLEIELNAERNLWPEKDQIESLTERWNTLVEEADAYVKTN